MIAALFWLVAQATPTPTPPWIGPCLHEATVARLPRPTMPSDFPSGKTATAAVKVWVGPEGTVTKAEIYRTSGYVSADAAALAKAEATVYSPKVVDCKPTTGVYLFIVDFPPG